MANPVITAYRVGTSALKIIAARADRQWMTQTTSSFANRCLPLRLANQFGWFILNDQTVEAVWSGGETHKALKLSFPDGRNSAFVASHFGHGIITWHIPFLFRTPPGYNLLVRGPTNWLKYGVVALDGLVETDWAVATFTMNWKLTCVATPVTFYQNEPICMITPVLRGQLEAFIPEIRSLDENSELKLQFEAWSQSRDNFLKELKGPNPAVLWQKHYFKGTSPVGPSLKEHQTRIKFGSFVDHTTPVNREEANLSEHPIDPLRTRRKAKSLWAEIRNRIMIRK